jgi:hypothetical protein
MESFAPRKCPQASGLAAASHRELDSSLHSSASPSEMTKRKPIRETRRRPGQPLKRDTNSVTAIRQAVPPAASQISNTFFSVRCRHGPGPSAPTM